MTEAEDKVTLQKGIVAYLKAELEKAQSALSDAEHEVWKEKPACESFKWIGQSFKHCDDCGKPYWEHTHDSRHVQGEGIVAVPITPEEAEKVKAKWG